jgi:hypothetical protein
VISGYAAAMHLKENWLPKIAGGQALVVLAYQERKARYRLDRVRRDTPAKTRQQLDASAAPRASCPCR